MISGKIIPGSTMDNAQETENRLYPEQPVAGVGVVTFKDGCLLMVRRGKEPNKGKWSIPGGKVELGETLYEAGCREVFEECSVEVEIERVLDASDTIIRDEDGGVRYHFVLIDLLAKYKGGIINAQSDAADCRWVALPEMAELDITPQLHAVLKHAGIL